MFDIHCALITRWDMSLINCLPETSFFKRSHLASYITQEHSERQAGIHEATEYQAQSANPSSTDLMCGFVHSFNLLGTYRYQTEHFQESRRLHTESTEGQGGGFCF